MAEAAVVLPMPISPSARTTTSADNASTAPRPASIARAKVASLIASSTLRSPASSRATGARTKRAASEEACASAPATPTSTTVSGTASAFASTLAAAPPAMKLRSIAAVASAGYADTPCSATG